MNLKTSSYPPVHTHEERQDLKELPILERSFGEEPHGLVSIQEGQAAQMCEVELEIGPRIVFIGCDSFMPALLDRIQTAFRSTDESEA